MMKVGASLALAIASPNSQELSRQDITVTGQIEQKREVRDFVRKLTSVQGPAPLARYEDSSFCPGVTGLGERRNDEIANRMRKVASAAGMTLASSDCRATAIVIITAEKGALIRELRKAHPALFYDIDGRPIKIRGIDQPATVWHVEAQVDRRGLAVPMARGDVGDSHIYIVENNIAASRSNAAMRPVVVASVIVIEAKSLVGLTTRQVADYALMRAVSKGNIGRYDVSPEISILGLLGVEMGGMAPASVTDRDLAYLRAANERTTEFHASQKQKTRIAEAILRAPDLNSDP